METHFLTPFLHPLKNELIHEQDYRSREVAQAQIFEYIEIFYNRQRMYRSLNYVSPVQFESDNLTPFEVSTKPGLAQPDHAPTGAFEMGHTVSLRFCYQTFCNCAIYGAA